MKRMEENQMSNDSKIQSLMGVIFKEYGTAAAIAAFNCLEDHMRSEGYGEAADALCNAHYLWEQEPPTTPPQIKWLWEQWGINAELLPDSTYNQIDGVVEVTGHDMKDDPGLANPKHCIGKYRMGSPKTDGEAMYFMSSALVGDDVQANYPDARYEDLADMELGWTPSGERFQWEVTP